MAYEDDDYQGGTSNTNYGLAQNPLMPMGDPLAYARVGSAPEISAPGIHTQGVAPQPIVQPRPINVPEIQGPKSGGEGTNMLQPTQQEPSTAGPSMNSLQGLLQMKGMEDIVQPSGVGTTPAVVPTPGPGRVPTGVIMAKAAAPYQDMVNDAADKNGLDRNMFRAQLYQESQFNPSAKSPAGAQGIGQFMPATAKERGVDVNDPKSSIYGAASYLGELKQKYKDDGLALAAYNWGPGNVDKWLKTGVGLTGKPVPNETTSYVRTITGKDLVRPTGPVSQIEPPNINDPHFERKYEGWMKGSGKGIFGTPSPDNTTPPIKNYPTVGPMFGGPAMFTQTEQPFKPYMIAGAMQPPPASSTAPGFGEAPKPGQMSPHGGPYIQRPDGIYATDGDGKVVGSVVKGIETPKFEASKTEDKVSAKKVPATAPTDVGAGDTPNLGGGVSQPAIDPNKVVPGATPPTAAPVQDQGQQQQPLSSHQTLFGANSSPQMQKLWQYMLIKSLFPQLQFRNVGYDPWAVHKFGQGGGY